jgi:repressor LexA
VAGTSDAFAGSLEEMPAYFAKFATLACCSSRPSPERLFFQPYAALEGELARSPISAVIVIAVDPHHLPKPLRPALSRVDVHHRLCHDHSRRAPFRSTGEIAELLDLLEDAFREAHTATAMSGRFTPRQGQFLAFIYYFTKLNRQAPSEAEMAEFFGLTPPSVHQMITTLEKRGLIERTPGRPRSIRLLIDRDSIPDLK